MNGHLPSNNVIYVEMHNSLNRAMSLGVSSLREMPLFIVLYCLIFFSMITSLKNCWLLLTTCLFNDNKLLTGKVSMSLCLLVSCLHFLFVGAFGNVSHLREV